MGDRRTTLIERLLNRIEDHVEHWRQEDAARKAAVAAQREVLWAEAREREKLLAEAVSEEESRRGPLEQAVERQEVIFVVHSEEAARAIETCADRGSRLASVVPGKGAYGGNTGLKGSWLVFETPE
ncbi:hypothetical protein BH18ACT10_BH18ACT10_04500 [soil metagenome]|nr:hypothetical protein [Rubrobacter sp.]